MSTMTRTEFDFLRDLVRIGSRRSCSRPARSTSSRAGWRRSPAAKVSRSVGDLVQRTRAPAARSSLCAQVVDAMTTNETSFFRDVHPWQTLKKEILPALFDARAAFRRLTIWCAACSSGQEPYSLAMLLKDEFAEQCATWDITISATDLSGSMVKRCTEGLFSQLEVNRGVPAPTLARHFRRDGAEWRIDAGIRRMLEVRVANLVVPSSLPAMGGIDLVLLRNVLIYFDDPTKARILADVRARMHRDGFLLLGSSEVTTVAGAGFAREQSGKTILFRPS